MSADLLILVLLIGGLTFMTLEAFAPAFGLLGLAGAASFISALFLLEDQASFYGVHVNIPLLIGLGVIGGVILAFSAYFTYKTRKTSISAGVEIMQGMPARVIEWHGHTGRVHVDGETWQAQGPEGLVIGDTVEVSTRNNLVLTVIKEG